MISATGSFEAILGLVEERTGLVIPHSRRKPAEDAIRKAMAVRRIAEPATYLARLDDAAVLDELADEITIHETYFFRDVHQLDAIARTMLPEVIGRRGPDHVLRIWSAGCATGEEPYSLAMLLDHEGLSRRARVLGTDLARRALEQARRGRYSAWSLRGPGAVRAMPYLTPRGTGWEVLPRIRELVDLAYVNLATDRYPSLTEGLWGMDLIVCRNVLIYFGGRTIAAVARRLHATLAEGGWLVLGASDPPLWAHADFETVVLDGAVALRRRFGSVAASRGPEPIEVHRADTIRAAETPASVPSSAPAARTATQPPTSAPRSVIREAPVATANGVAAAVRALADVDERSAEQACVAAIAVDPMSAELHHVRAILLLAQGRLAEAREAARRAIYLVPDLAVGHFVLATIAARQHDRAGARGAFRRAAELAGARPADELVALGDGETAGRFRDAAVAQLALLDAQGPDRPS